MPRGARLAIPVVAGVLAAAGAWVVLDGAGDGDAPAVAPPAGGARVVSAATDASPDGLAVFARMGCGSCHHLAAAGSRGGMAPDLDAALPRHSAVSLRAKILDPYPGAGAIGAMPEDFASRLSDAELDALVAFLLASR